MTIAIGGSRTSAKWATWRTWEREPPVGVWRLCIQQGPGQNHESECQQSAFWPFRVVQGHPRSMILVIVTMVLSCTVSEIRRLIGWKNAYFSYPSLIRRPRSLCSLWNFAV